MIDMFTDARAEILRAMELTGASRSQAEQALAGMMPALNRLVAYHREESRLRGYNQGQNDGLGRAHNRPGQGDMGG